MWRDMRRAPSGPVHQGWPKIQKFPLRGRGGRAQRNRTLVTAAALGVGGTALAGGIAYGNFVPVLRGHVRSANYSYPSVPGGVASKLKAVGHSHRIVGEDEVEAFRKLSRLIGPHRVKRLFTLEKIGPNTYTLPAGSLMTRMGPYMRQRLTERMDQSSLWNIAGRGNLHSAIENTTRGLKTLVARKIPRWTRPLRNAFVDYVGRPIAAVDTALKGGERQIYKTLRRTGLKLRTAGWKTRAGIVGGVAAGVMGAGYGIHALRRKAEARA